MPSIRMTGKGRNMALIDPLTGQKVFIQDKDNTGPSSPHMALMEAII